MSRVEAEIRLVNLMCQRLKGSWPELVLLIRYMELIARMEEHSMAATPLERRLKHSSVMLPGIDKQRAAEMAKKLSEPGLEVTPAAIIRASLHAGLNLLEELEKSTTEAQLQQAAELLISKGARLRPETARRLRAVLGEVRSTG